MLLSELLDRSEQLAQGVAGAPAPQVDREITAYTIYPHAARAVFREQARTGRHLENLTVEHFIKITNGEGLLPDTVLREFMDRSYLPRQRFGSMVAYEDYPRYRYNRQLSYYAIKAAKVYYNGDLPISEPSCTATLLSSTITGDASAAQVGDRFYLLDASNVLVINAIIASINGTTNFTVRGNTIIATTAATAGAIYNGQDDVVERSVTDLVTNTASQTVTSVNAEFTSADLGKRIRAYATGTTTIVVDAIIQSVTSATAVILSAKPLATDAGTDAAIMYTPLVLVTPSIPAIPCDLCDDLAFSPEVAEDIIVKIAQVLRAEIPMQMLIDLGYGKTK